MTVWFFAAVNRPKGPCRPPHRPPGRPPSRPPGRPPSPRDGVTALYRGPCRGPRSRSRSRPPGAPISASSRRTGTRTTHGGAHRLDRYLESAATPSRSPSSADTRSRPLAPATRAFHISDDSGAERDKNYVTNPCRNVALHSTVPLLMIRFEASVADQTKTSSRRPRLGPDDRRPSRAARTGGPRCGALVRQREGPREFRCGPP